MAIKEKIYDFLHKTAVSGLFFIAGVIVYDGAKGFYQHRKDKAEWTKNNPRWEDDPFYVYNPNYMRLKKKSEEEIVYTRPQYYAAKDLRSKYGMAFQPPYELNDDHRALTDMEGKKLAEDTEGYQHLHAEDGKKRK